MIVVVDVKASSTHMSGLCCIFNLISHRLCTILNYDSRLRQTNPRRERQIQSLHIDGYFCLLLSGGHAVSHANWVCVLRDEIRKKDAHCNILNVKHQERKLQPKSNFAPRHCTMIVLPCSPKVLHSFVAHVCSNEASCKFVVIDVHSLDRGAREISDFRRTGRSIGWDLLGYCGMLRHSDHCEKSYILHMVSDCLRAQVVTVPLYKLFR